MLRNHLLTGALLTLTLAPLACGEPVTSTNSGGSPAIGGANTGGSPAAGGAPNAGGSLTGGSPSGGEASGGASSGGANSGGGGSATGGATSDSGGSASGGAAPNDNLFRCPDGSDTLTPTLGTATAATTAPPVPPNPNDGSYRTEGPVWVNGALYVSAVRDWGSPYPPARPLKWDGAGFVEVLPLETSGTNGMALASDGTIIAASHLVGGLLKIDITTDPATVTTLVAEYEGARFNSPNDLAIRSDGTIYFSDPDWQCSGGCTQPAKRVYRYSAGQVSEVVTGHTNPNGLALSPDEKTLYVTGLENMQSLPINPDGSVGAATQFAPLQQADGMAIDCAGNIYVAANSAITVLDKAGATIGTINVAATPNNAAFGGPEGKTLYITTQPPGVVYSIDVGVPGYPY
jgi:gluconolactonase